MKCSRFLVAACAGCLGAATSTQAAIYTFDGHSGVDSNWSTANNWVGNAVPVDGIYAGSDITLRTGANVSNVDLPWSVNTLTVASGTTYTLTGSQLDVHDNIDVTATAKLYVNNTTNSWYGKLTVGDNASHGAATTLGGNGTIACDVALTATGWPPFGNDTVLSPGDPAINGGIGTFTITKSLSMSANGASLNFVFGAAGNSKVAVGTALDLTQGTAVNITSLGGVTPGIYDLITYNGAAISSTTLNGDGAGLYGGNPGVQLNLPAGWSASLVSTVGHLSLDVTSVSVPEPVGLGLLTVGAAGLLARRRRQRCHA